MKVRNPTSGGFHEPIRTCRLDHSSDQLRYSSVRLGPEEVDGLIVFGEGPAKPVFQFLAEAPSTGLRRLDKPPPGIGLKPSREHGRSTDLAAVFPPRPWASLSHAACPKCTYKSMEVTRPGLAR
jgi:hypothetical protein